MSHNLSVGRIVAGLVLLGLGLIFLISEFLQVNVWTYLWPLFIIAVGVAFLIAMLAGTKESSGLAVPGSLFIGLGAVMFVQNLFGIWETWSYAWTLILVSLGVGIFVMGVRSEQPGARRAGVLMVAIGIVLFVVAGALFEIGFGILGWRQGGNLIWPLLLVLAGVALLVFRGEWWAGLLGNSPAPQKPAAALPLAPPPSDRTPTSERK